MGPGGRPHPVDPPPPPASPVKPLWERRLGTGRRSPQPGRDLPLAASTGRGRPVSAKLAEAPPLAAVAPWGPCGWPISLQTLGPRAEGREGDIAVVLRPRREHT